MNKLESIYKKIDALNHSSSILSWDLACLTPSASVTSRLDTMAQLEILKDELLISKELKDSISEIKDNNNYSTEEKIGMEREIKREIFYSTSLPSDLKEKLTIATGECEIYWRNARKENNWKGFLPYLKKVINLTKEKAKIRSEKMDLSKYDTLIDHFEPGIKKDQIEKIFKPVSKELPSLINKIIEKQHSSKKLVGNFPTNSQEKLSKEISKKIGLDFTKARIDTSTHPFCGGHMEDVRLTTRFDESDFTSSMLGSIHETGHALYEQNRPKHLKIYPVSNARSMMIHESQSLFFEMQVGRDNNFLKYIYPTIKEYLNESVKDLTLDQLTNHTHKVTKDLIRIDADEATYPLHILTRFYCEQAIFNDEITVEELPEFFNMKMENYLGVKSSNYADGVMQDVHWPAGLFGYFPSYALGAFFAAQLKEEIAKDVNWNGLLRDGNFFPIRERLNQKVWSRGSILTTPELIIESTGKELSADAFLRHLKNRYLNE